MFSFQESSVLLVRQSIYVRTIDFYLLNEYYIYVYLKEEYASMDREEWGRAVAELLAGIAKEHKWDDKYIEMELHKRLPNSRYFYVNDVFNNRRSVPRYACEAWAEIFGIPVDKLIFVSYSSDTDNSKERLTDHLREIITKLTKIAEKQLCYIFSDLEYNDLYCDGGLIEQFHAGGALSAGAEAIKNDIVPIICSAVGNNKKVNNENEFINWIKDEYPEFITSLIKEKDTDTNSSSITFSKNRREDVTTNRQNSFQTDLKTSEIKELIQMSCISNSDESIIFVHTFQMFRLLNVCFNEKMKEDTLKEYMQAFRTEKENSHPFIILQLGPSLMFHQRFTSNEIKTIIGYCDMVDIDICIAVDVLNLNKNIKSVGKLKKEDIEPIIKHFLGGKKGDTLLLRFGGEDRLDRILIFQRKTEKEYVYFKNNSFISYKGEEYLIGEDTGYKDFDIKKDNKKLKKEIEKIKDPEIRQGFYNGIKRIGYEEKLLFEHLSIIMKNRKKIIDGKNKLRNWGSNSLLYTL